MCRPSVLMPWSLAHRRHSQRKYTRNNVLCPEKPVSFFVFFLSARLSPRFCALWWRLGCGRGCSTLVTVVCFDTHTHTTPAGLAPPWGWCVTGGGGLHDWAPFVLQPHAISVLLLSSISMPLVAALFHSSALGAAPFTLFSHISNCHYSEFKQKAKNGKVRHQWFKSLVFFSHCSFIAFTVFHSEGKSIMQARNVPRMGSRVIFFFFISQI